MLGHSAVNQAEIKAVRQFRNNFSICQLKHQNTDNCCQLMQSEIVNRNIFAENPGGSAAQAPTVC